MARNDNLNHFFCLETNNDGEQSVVSSGVFYFLDNVSQFQKKIIILKC